MAHAVYYDAIASYLRLSGSLRRWLLIQKLLAAPREKIVCCVILTPLPYTFSTAPTIQTCIHIHPMPSWPVSNIGSLSVHAPHLLSHTRIVPLRRSTSHRAPNNKIHPPIIWVVVLAHSAAD